MGSNIGIKNQGWQANIYGGSNDSFIRFYINGNSSAPSQTTETGYLGDKGYQFRNAMFVKLSTNAHYWEFLSMRDEIITASWSEASSEYGWEFKRLGDVFVAIKLLGKTAAIEIGQLGDDNAILNFYPSYQDFKNAIISNSVLTLSSYTTSRGITIDDSKPCGINIPGDCVFPFSRIKTDSSRGLLINWDSQKKMTVTSYNGYSCIYDFSTWTYSGDCD